MTIPAYTTDRDPGDEDDGAIRATITWFTGPTFGCALRALILRFPPTAPALADGRERDLSGYHETNQ